MKSKTCFKCSIEKPLGCFYRHLSMSDGFLNKCKDCTKKDTKENREKNIEYYREYDRYRFQNDPRVKERHTRYQKTEAGKKASAKAKQKWAKQNPIKRLANNVVNNAVRDGKLIKPDRCENCEKFSKRLEGHHDDYAFPLVVRWLCPQCHTSWHKEHGEGLNS